MAIVDVILVNVRGEALRTEYNPVTAGGNIGSSKVSTGKMLLPSTVTIYREIPTYIVRDHVVSYGEYMDIQGVIDPALTTVSLLSITPTPVQMVVILPLADFNTLMTT